MARWKVEQIYQCSTDLKQRRKMKTPVFMGEFEAISKRDAENMAVQGKFYPHACFLQATRIEEREPDGERS